MWLANPKLMCDRHLLGEHVEIHMIVGSMRKQKRLDGFFNNRLIQLDAIYNRHQELVNEMQERGMDHNSPLDQKEIRKLSRKYKEFKNVDIDVESNIDDLCNRCSNCRKKTIEHFGENLQFVSNCCCGGVSEVASDGTARCKDCGEGCMAIPFLTKEDII